MLLISGIFNQNLGVGGSSDKEEIMAFQIPPERGNKRE